MPHLSAFSCSIVQKTTQVVRFFEYRFTSLFTPTTTCKHTAIVLKYLNMKLAILCKCLNLLNSCHLLSGSHVISVSKPSYGTFENDWEFTFSRKALKLSPNLTRKLDSTANSAIFGMVSQLYDVFHKRCSLRFTISEEFPRSLLNSVQHQLLSTHARITYCWNILIRVQDL